MAERTGAERYLDGRLTDPDYRQTYNDTARKLEYPNELARRVAKAIGVLTRRPGWRGPSPS